MRNNPRDWRIEDLLTIAKRYGIEIDHDGTSHVIFRHSAGREAVPAAKRIKPVYIRRFVKFIEKVRGGASV